MDTTTRTETRFASIATPDAPFALLNGDNLTNAQIAYETYGELNADRSNAVLVFHALSGSQHAAGFTESVPGVGDRWTEECRTGWWDGFVGSGKAIDTDHFFVICANYIGGCYGSTGPSSINPTTDRPYGSTFPRVTLPDIVRSQIQLLDQLGIERLHACVGASLGGILAQILATRFPDRVGIVVPFATGCEVTPLQRLLNFEQIFAIESDPGFHGGDYPSDAPPNHGLAVARMIGHKTFVSLEAMQERAHTEIIQRSDDLGWYQLNNTLESYMLHQAQKFVKRFDANTYLRILNAWQTMDMLRGLSYPSVEVLFKNCRKQRFLVFTIDSDVCFYPEEQNHLVKLLKSVDVDVTWITVHSDKGHDSFLLEPLLYQPYLRSFLMD